MVRILRKMDSDGGRWTQMTDTFINVYLFPQLQSGAIFLNYLKSYGLRQAEEAPRNFADGAANRWLFKQ